MIRGTMHARWRLHLALIDEPAALVVIVVVVVVVALVPNVAPSVRAQGRRNMAGISCGAASGRRIQLRIQVFHGAHAHLVLLLGVFFVLDLLVAIDGADGTILEQNVVEGRRRLDHRGHEAVPRDDRSSVFVLVRRPHSRAFFECVFDFL